MRQGAMENKKMATLLAFMGCCLLCHTSAAPTLVVFGDSLSDNGNGSQRVYVDFFRDKNETNLKSWPESPPYYEGRWSNGPVWADVAAPQLGLALLDFAIGGAPSGAGRVLTQRERVAHPDGTAAFYVIPIPSMLDQVSSYSPGSNPAADFVVIWIGGNDYLSQTASPSGVIAAVDQAVDALISKGHQRFILVTTPEPEASSDLAPVFHENNQLVRDYVATTFPAAHRGAQVYLWDAAAAHADIVANAAALGFTSMDPCLQGYSKDAPVCSNPAQHLRWDPVHPTAAVHALLGNNFVQLIKPYLARETAS